MEDIIIEISSSAFLAISPLGPAACGCSVVHCRGDVLAQKELQIGRLSLDEIAAPLLISFVIMFLVSFYMRLQAQRSQTTLSQEWYRRPQICNISGMAWMAFDARSDVRLASLKL